jgi:allantoinase
LPELVLRARRVVLPDGVRPASVVVEAGRIVTVGGYDDGGEDVGDAVLMPGVVDTHVHVNEPGRTAWEGWESATRAAAAGGVTTLVEMPLNSIPATVTVDALQAKVASIAGRCSVDVGLWGGVVPGNQAELRPLWEAGVRGFKCFLAPSGVEEFSHVGEADLRLALPVLAELGAPLLVHAEDPAVLARAAAGGDGASYADYLRSRPPEAEVEAIRTLLGLCREYGTRIHIVHLAASEALPLLREARAEGLPVTVETCPHYLHFSAADAERIGTALKCAPPVRGAENRERLWAALAAGDVDLVASDHSPAPPELKAGDWRSAWGGIASLQLGLPVVWTGAQARGMALEQLAEWMCAAPARLAGLERKGAIEPGRDADVVVFDPDAEWKVDAAKLHHRHPLTPYHGAVLAGVVRRTYVRGTLAYDGEGFPAPPTGRFLPRGGP